jgi:hypothetical protein
MRALQKITTARLAVIQKSPELVLAAMRLKLTEGDSTDTVSIDGESVVFNPRYIEGLSYEDVQRLVRHATDHLLAKSTVKELDLPTSTNRSLDEINAEIRTVFARHNVTVKRGVEGFYNAVDDVAETSIPDADRLRVLADEYDAVDAIATKLLDVKQTADDIDRLIKKLNDQVEELVPALQSAKRLAASGFLISAQRNLKDPFFADTAYRLGEIRKELKG